MLFEEVGPSLIAERLAEVGHIKQANIIADCIQDTHIQQETRQNIILTSVQKYSKEKHINKVLSKVHHIPDVHFKEKMLHAIAIAQTNEVKAKLKAGNTNIALNIAHNIQYTGIKNAAINNYILKHIYKNNIISILQLELKQKELFK